MSHYSELERIIPFESFTDRIKRALRHIRVVALEGLPELVDERNGQMRKVVGTSLQSQLLWAVKEIEHAIKEDQ